MWISLYYVAFYVVMTGLFALCLYVLMQTIDPYTPDYQDQLKSPGKCRWDGSASPKRTGPNHRAHSASASVMTTDVCQRRGNCSHTLQAPHVGGTSLENTRGPGKGPETREEGSERGVSGAPQAWRRRGEGLAARGQGLSVSLS